MTRWTEADLLNLQSRTVSTYAMEVIQRVKKPLIPLPRYTAKPGWFDGMYFGSQRELKRYKDLKLMRDAEVIGCLKVHPRYELHANGVRLGYIELDFEYLDHSTGKMVYEDVKDPKKNSSTRTAIFKWKRRHLEAEHRITITEVA